jgi:hypothetical protein
MTTPRHLKVADLGAEVTDLVNSQDHPLFKEAKLSWCAPRLWERKASAPVKTKDGPCVYAIIRNHGKSRQKDIIEYIGLTKKPNGRFPNHPTAKAIVSKRGTTHLSMAPIDFIRYRNKIANTKRALEEIEHILIWTMQPRYNIKKNYTLPGMGKNGGNAWHITNAGYRFSGQLPLEIVFPWILIRSGRNRSQRGLE